MKFPQPFVSVVATVAAFLSGATAMAVPLSSRPSGSGPHYFGYFAGAMEGVGVPSDGCPSGDYTACVQDHANVMFVVGKDQSVPNWLQSWTDKVQEANNLGMGVVLYVGSFFFEIVAVPGGAIVVPKTGQALTDGWQAWAQLSNALLPFQSSLVSFYIDDEPPTDATTLSFIETVAQQLGFPAVHRQLTFMAKTIESSNFVIPHGVDWVGYDCYVTTTTNPTFEQCSGPGWKSVPFYTGRLKSIVAASNAAYAAAGQSPTTFGLVLFPIAWEDVQIIAPGQPGVTLDANSPDTSSAAQARILVRVEREIAMAENDPDYVMIMPFLWQSDYSGRPDAQGFSGVGVNQLPTVKAYYQALGKHVTTGTDRLAFPTSVSASTTYLDNVIDLAFDDDTTTFWSSGAYAPGPFVVATYSDPITVTRFTSVIAQNPTSQVVYSVTGHHADGSTTSLQSFSGTMSDGQIVTSALFPSTPIVAFDVATQTSQSWIGWRELEVMTPGSSRLYAYPYAASSSYDATSVPENISDGDPTTTWNSGTPVTAGAPAPFIELDLGQTQTLSRIVLTVAQSPWGNTTHRVLGGPLADPASMSVLGTLSGLTSDGDKLTLEGPFTNVRYLYIETTESPSWVGWREIDLFK
jgi:hypothetical protein